MDINGIGDMSRPFFARPSGQCGIYISLYDVTPDDPEHYGSRQFMLVDMRDKLYEHLTSVPLDTVKYAFETKGLLLDVVLENWHKGVILAVGFNSQEAITQLWRDYENIRIEPIIKQVVRTPALLKAMGAKQISLHVRMWQDEMEAAKMELERILLRPFTLQSKANDIAMMRKAHKFQKGQFLSTMETLRLEYDRMDGQMSQMTALLRQALPPKVLEFKNFKEFQHYAKRLYARNQPFKKPYEEYLFIRERIVAVTKQVQEFLIAPLLLVHSVVETEAQQDLKVCMRQECINNHLRLTEDYDWSHLKHPEYMLKIIHREHTFFLGMASVVGAGMNTLVELDQQLDEYWSGVDSDVKLI